jgi:hypothetical protein
MKVRSLIALALAVVGAGTALTAMNNTCKGGHHTWCAPIAEARQPHAQG